LVEPLNRRRGRWRIGLLARLSQRDARHGKREHGG
jgi:hypothetical protein